MPYTNSQARLIDKCAHLDPQKSAPAWHPPEPHMAMRGCPLLPILFGFGDHKKRDQNGASGKPAKQQI
jgi:hypothetical protein